jgi:hypothetical protein
MTYQIVPIAKEHISGFHAAIDVVARERRYLAHLGAPPFEETRRFVLGNIEHGYPQFAVVSADTVVGWCDVLPNRSRVIYRTAELWESVCYRSFAEKVSVAS